MFILKEILNLLLLNITIFCLIMFQERLTLDFELLLKKMSVPNSSLLILKIIPDLEMSILV